MRRFALAVVSLAFLLCSRSVRAQVDPMLEQGIKPFGAYSSDFESISMVNGGLTIHFPLFSYPQRGNKLTLNLRLDYESSGWSVAGTSQNPPITITMSDMLLSGFKINEDQHLMEQPGCLGFSQGGFPQITSPDGSAHQLGQTSLVQGIQGFESVDATGISLSGYQFNTQANKVSLVGVITDREGIRYTPGTYLNGGAGQNAEYQSWATGQPVNYSKEDPNGNSISFTTTSGWTDTLGRQIPSPPFIGKSGATDSSGCLGPLAIYSAYVWALPGPSGGTTQLKVCLVNIPVHTHFFPNNTEYDTIGNGQFTIQSVLIYNGNSWMTSPAWVFEYQDHQAGDPSGNYYGGLTKITFPTGGVVSYTYVTFNAGTGTYNRAVSSKTVDANDGSGPHTWGYSYSLTTNGLTTTVTDPLGNDTVHTLTQLGYAAFYPTEVDYYQGSHSGGALLKSVKTDYRSLPLKTPCSGSHTGAVDVAAIRTTTIWPNGQQTKTETDYDSNLTFTIGTSTQYTASYGNPTNKRDYDYGSGAPGSLLRTATTNYLAFSNSTYLANNLLALPTSVQVTNSGGTQVAYTSYGYDGSGLVSSGISTQHGASPYGANPGNLTSVARWLNTTGGSLTSTTAYFDTGEVYTTTTPKGNTTTFNPYMCTGAFPQVVTNAKGQPTTYNYDCNTGLVLSVKDPNNLTTSHTYDARWRLAQTSHPNGGLDSYCYTDEGGTGCSLGSPPYQMVTTSKLISGNMIKTEFFDGLGRSYERQSNSDPGGVDYVVTTYDPDGRVATVTNPYRSTSDPTYGVTSYGYDALGRKTLVTEPDTSTVMTSFTGNSTTVTDEASKTRQSFSDGLGRLTEVIENPGGLNYITNYGYDALDNLTSVVQNGSRSRSFVYDSLSRLLTSNNPEIASPTTGAACPITYTYDGDGNLATKVAPAPNQNSCSTTVTTTYSYEPLERLTGKTYSNGDPSVTYAYDGSSCLGLTSCVNIGRRTSMTDAGGSESWAYDVVNKKSADQRTTNSLTKTTTYAYDYDGAVASLTYPSGHTLNYTYNTMGQTTQAIDDASAYMQNGTYGPHGQLVFRSVGVSANLNVVYDSRLQPCWVYAGIVPGDSFALSYGCTQSGVPTGSLLDLQFNYSLGAGDNGNVLGVTNRRNTNRSQTFSYDQLNRLQTAGTVSACTSGCWSQTFGYDPWANLLTVAATGTAASLSLAVNANNHITTAPFSYDAAGNETADGAGTYTWNAEGQLKAAGGVTYTYDGDGHRVQKSNGKIYWYGTNRNVLNETDATGSVTNSAFNQYTYVNGLLIARRDYQGNAYFYFDDQIGSARSMAYVPAGTRTATLCYEGDFYPYGAESIVTNTCPQNYKFTGKERDAETGNDNFDARYYSSVYERFLRPDPISATPLHGVDPQRWNRYTYVVDNPLAYTDQDGKDAVAVTFSREIPIGGHQGLIVVHSDGKAMYARFGPVEENSSAGPGKVKTFPLDNVKFGTNGLPTDASYARIAEEVAELEHQPASTVELNYFKTSEASSMMLQSWIDQMREASDRGAAPSYQFNRQNCAAFCIAGLLKANAIPNRGISLVPNRLFTLLSPLATQNYTWTGSTPQSQPEPIQVVTHKICGGTAQRPICD